MIEVSGEADNGFDFQLEILRDASTIATRFWRNHLWAQPHEAYAPSEALFLRFGARYGEGGIREAWASWFAVLTGDEYFVAMTGLDLSLVGDEYGRTHGRSSHN